MRSGDTVRDGQGNAYQVGQLLGRGAWGKSFVVRRETDDVLFILKLPLGPDDLPEKTPAPDSFFAVCREALMEQARLYEQGQLPFLPKLEARFTAPDGQPALLVPRYAESLEKRIVEGLSVGALVETMLNVAKHVRQLAGSGATGAALHGGLRPSNILFSERGDIFLSDVATPVVRKNVATLAGLHPGGQPYLPPEICLPAQEPPWAAVADTWAIAMIVWRGIMGPAVPVVWPHRGLDKSSIGELKARLLERMKAEDSNPRFHGRLAERVGVLLSRALSVEIAPSPPFRFTRLDELVQRLDEITSLIRPQVTALGKVMTDRQAARAWFETNETAAFSVTVGASVGVEGHEEIGVGIAVFDTSKEERLKDLDLRYTVDKHPSGRYRFMFEINGLAPARYRVRLAFAIRDSGQQPATVETELEVRAAPGWVPPADAPVAQPLAFIRENTGVTRPAMDPAAFDAPSATLIPAPIGSLIPATPPSDQTAGSTPYSHDPQPVPTPAAVAPIADRHPGIRPADAPSAPARPALVPPPTPLTPPPLTNGTVRPVERPVRSPTEPHPVATVTPLPRPILPEGSDPIPAHVPAGTLSPTSAAPTQPIPIRSPLAGPASPIATPIPPAPAATLHSDEPQFEPPKNWTYEPIPKAKTFAAAAPAADERPSQSGLDDDLELAPSPLHKAFAALKNDPYVLVMAGLGTVIALLLIVFLALKR